VTATALAFSQAVQAADKDPAPAVPAGPEVAAGATLTEQYSDNIFATRTGKIADWITVLTPYARVRFPGRDGELTVGASAALGRYATHRSENFDDYRLYSDARYRILSNTVVVAGASHERKHEERSAPDPQQGDTPTVYNVSRAYGAALTTFDRGSLRLGGTFEHYDFKDVAAGPAVINNDDRDRDMSTIGTRVGFNLNERDEVFGIVTYDRRRYRDSIDDFGFHRDSHGWRASVGLRQRFSTMLESEFYFGWLAQRYDDPRFSELSTVDFGARINWTPTPATTVAASLERRLLETTLVGSSGYLQTSASVDLIHWIRPDLRAAAGFQYDLDDFLGIDRQDRIATASLGLRYYPWPYFFVGGDVAFISRDSTVISESYNESRMMVRAGISNEPAFAPADVAKSATSVLHSGYVGLETSQTNVATKLFGARGNDGQLQADFSDLGWANGGFVGYGIFLGDWYVGAEANVGAADGSWNHARVPGGRVFSVERDIAFGVSGLVGKSFAGGNMLYGRAGLVSARIHTKYQHGNNTVDDGRSLGGFQIGLGGSVPLTPSLALRLQHTFAAFGSTFVNYGSGVDDFTNDETATSVGLMYRFGPEPRRPDPPLKASFGGSYVGFQAGHGSLYSRTTGPREGGSNLTAAFGDTGFTGGLFAGYGVQAGPFYAAVEAEGELAAMRWDHEREATGRTFSLEKQGSFGASGRVGYVVNDAALIYVGGGFVRSLFELAYHRGMHDNFTKTAANGLRYGGGIEFPVNDALFVRLDFTHTDYRGSIAQVTNPAGETDLFASREDLFRVGALYRFMSR